MTEITLSARASKDNPLIQPSECATPGRSRVEIASPVSGQLWDVDVFVEQDGDRRISSVTVEADSEDEAVRKAIVEISRALAFLSPFTKVVGARARRKQ